MTTIYISVAGPSSVDTQFRISISLIRIYEAQHINNGFVTSAEPRGGILVEI